MKLVIKYLFGFLGCLAFGVLLVYQVILDKWYANIEQ